MDKPRILFTNDDGCEAEGLLALAKAFSKYADVWVVAPDRDRSAYSHAISVYTPLRINQLKRPQSPFPAGQGFSVDGTPADCVYLALHHLLPKPPDLVISGINHGLNLGSDVIYSGTVSAAMEAAILGYPAMAISLEMPTNGQVAAKRLTNKALKGKAAPSLMDFREAASVALRIAKALRAQPMPVGMVLNVNVPLWSLKAVKLCRLGYSDWSNIVFKRVDPRGKPYYWLGGERSGYDIPDSDNNALKQGYITCTPLHFDLTDPRFFAYTRSLEFAGLPKIADALGAGPLLELGHPQVPEHLQRARSVVRALAQPVKRRKRVKARS